MSAQGRERNRVWTRLILGAPPLGMVRDADGRRLATWERWAGVVEAAQGG